MSFSVNGFWSTHYIAIMLNWYNSWISLQDELDDENISVELP
jgi:hypothetical protein